MANILNNPQVLATALLGGMLPSLLWLWFWLKEDEKKPEPKGLLAGVFILGMLAVIFVVPAQQLIQSLFPSYTADIILWAALEEIIKFLAVIILIRKTYMDEPLDWPIYMITAALGFAALENAMFLIQPLSLGQNTVGLLTGQLRFLGSTLLHTVSSGIFGVFLGLSMGAGSFKKKLYFGFGLLFAISLHSVFNFFIMKETGNDVLRVLGFLWGAAVAVMLLFEKVRRLSGDDVPAVQKI